MNKIHLDSREPKDVQEDCKKTFGKENVVVEFMLIGDLIFPKEIPWTFGIRSSAPGPVHKHRRKKL